MENKDNSVLYSVSDKTVRCITLLKEIIAIQENGSYILRKRGYRGFKGSGDLR